MIECFFSSISGGDSLKKAILTQLEQLSSIDSKKNVSVAIFAFSLTDQEIANKIISLAKNNQLIDFRIIADWSQRGIKGNKQLFGLSKANLANISVRYKLDQPYIQTENQSRIKWSYRQSQGLLHHKTLSVSINGKFEFLILGSFNWTKNATKNYENLLILYPENHSILDVFNKFQNEFDWMWFNSNITSSPLEANNHFDYIKSKLALSSPNIPIFSKIEQNSETTKSNLSNKNATILVAFNSKSFNQQESNRGYHPQNNTEKFILTKPQGKEKVVPLDITNLVLEIIHKAKEGDNLKLASYALSTKATEFGALIEAARRKVTVYLLLDKKINRNLVQRIEEKYAHLPIHIRTTSKRLHSKYIIHQASNTVLTGTANFTMDASKRHSEHRLLIKDEKVTNAFLEDFKTIWNRVKKREEDKPRLYLSNNGYVAKNIPYNKNIFNFLNFKVFKRFFLGICHKYLHFRYFFKKPIPKNNPFSIEDLMKVIETKANQHSFTVFLIGSFIDYIKETKVSSPSDIDLCICPIGNRSPKYTEIENFLLFVRQIGLKNKVSFDIKYSQTVPNLSDKILNPDQKISFIKLYSPYLQNKVLKGVLKKYQFLGKYLIQFDLKAIETNFFKKLPESQQNSKKILRGAIALKNLKWPIINT